MSFRYNDKRVQFANCNGIHIEVRKYWGKGHDEADAYFMLTIADAFDEYSEADEYEHETEADALVEEYRDKPNCNAQAAYDEAHGTINGEDAGIVAWREAVGEY